jgi:hypothetical protein
MSVSDYVGWYGAIVATLGLAYEWWWRRPRLRLEVRSNDPVRQDVHPEEPGRPKGVLVLQNPTASTVVLQRVLLSKTKSVDGLHYLLTDRYDAGSQSIAPGASIEVEFGLREAEHYESRWLIVEAQDGRIWRRQFNRKDLYPRPDAIRRSLDAQ